MSLNQIYKIPILVGKNDIDQFNHVNNEVYVTWLLKAATGHSESLGYSLQKYVDDGAGFVVRRHEIDYLAPAIFADKLVLETWIAEIGGLKSIRKFRLTRENDQKIILEAQTFWVYVNLKTGRPTAIPAELLNVFASQ